MRICCTASCSTNRCSGVWTLDRSSATAEKTRVVGWSIATSLIDNQHSVCYHSGATSTENVKCKLRRKISRSFKVIDFCPNRTSLCDFTRFLIVTKVICRIVSEIPMLLRELYPILTTLFGVNPWTVTMNFTWNLNDTVPCEKNRMFVLEPFKS